MMDHIDITAHGVRPDTKDSCSDGVCAQPAACLCCARIIPGTDPAKAELRPRFPK